MGLRLRWFVIFLALLALLGSKLVTSSSNEQATNPSRVIVRQNRLAKSLKVWNGLKAEHGDNYHYRVADGFLGFESITTITVQKGRVVTRTYEEGRINNKGELIVEKQYSWTETGAGVGSHENSGAAPRTVDELYKECRDNVLTRNPRAHDIYLDVGSDGVLRSCVYGFKGFAMDTYPGVSISTLEFLPAKND